MTDNIKEQVEDKIIDLIGLNGGGRLVVFKPENSAKDLVVEKRGDYKKRVISLRVFCEELAESNNSGNNFLKLADARKASPEENLYFVFVHFDFIKRDISDRFWVIPSVIFQELDEKSSLSRFLMNKKGFVRFLIETL